MIVVNIDLLLPLSSSKGPHFPLVIKDKSMVKIVPRIQDFLQENVFFQLFVIDCSKKQLLKSSSIAKSD